VKDLKKISLYFQHNTVVWPVSYHSYLHSIASTNAAKTLSCLTCSSSCI